MSVKNQPRLNFKGVEIHFVKVNVYNKYVDTELTHTIIPKIILDGEKSDNFKILMDVNLEAENSFKIEVALTGTFILNLDSDDGLKKIFMHQNAPAILFPYVRSFISTITANLGSKIGTIIIPPQAFMGDIEVIGGEEQNLENEKITD
jgi:preprotein translocase subunit SecB